MQRTKTGKRIAGVKKITLAPAEKQTISFTVPASQLAFYDEKTHGFTVEPGLFNIMVGSSSGDIRQSGQVTVL